MKVKINGYEIEFVLEHEKTVRDVATSVLNWARERDLIFTELFLNGDLFKLDECPDVAVNDSHEINCVVQSKSDLIISTMGEGTVYCEKVLLFADKAAEKGTADIKQKDYLSKGGYWLIDAVKSIFQLLSLDAEEIRYMDHPVSHYLKELDRFSGELAAIEDEKIFGEYLVRNRSIFEVVRAIFKMLYVSDNLKKTIMKSIESPNDLVDGLKAIKDELPSQIENLSRSSMAFQSGHDAEGADLLQSFTDFIYRYTKICHQIPPVFGVDLAEVSEGDANLEDVNVAIHSFLEEIVNVMENNDIISLSDILEYQMKGELEKCSKFIDILLGKIA